ncbi:hypothetical protein EDB19DRAFT_1152663 [Suillus lakei]|nr:hypothetical protein EDB19DRAFT_1152663 [Suillus lakei]
MGGCAEGEMTSSVSADAHIGDMQVIKLESSSHVGYQSKYTVFHGAHHYIEAIEAFQMMLAKLSDAHGMQIRKLREKYASPSKAEGVTRKVINVQLDTVPLRLLDTATGLLCDREAQISAFKTSTEYKQLLSSVMIRPESFCNVARHAGYHWAWVDTRCIDQNNHVELQKSLNSTFAWYHCSALTVVYPSDVAPSSKAGALAKSAWNTQVWTVPEFLAPKVIRFYQQDWTLYVDDDSPDHKESVEIMDELEDATGIDARALVAFQPGMRDAREKLQWASTRVTTIPEDIAYSLFGIFGIQLPILYGENAQNALGRLLQEIVARSGDITALDWVGQPSEFNSYLPAHISSYAAPPHTLPCLSEHEIQTAVSSLRHAVALHQASKLHEQLDNVTSPRLTNCRLRLPCMTFRVTEIRRRSGPPQDIFFTYRIKADGVEDLLIATEEKLVQFWPERPIRQTFLLAHPWDRRLLELPDFADDAERLGGCSEPESLLDHSGESADESPGERESVDSESRSRAIRLIACPGQPFGAFLLARQRSGEYKRIASDYDIIAQAKDVTSLHSMVDIRMLEIL